LENLGMKFELTEETNAEALPAEIRAGIRKADPVDVGARDWQPLALALRTPEGLLVGGAYGATMWGWLMIDGLWVSEELRRFGLGKRLMLAAEAAAVERGCHGSWLGTFDFQARGFYERLGYEVFGELQGFPAGHTHYSRRKIFAPPAS
jgi:GNAT superfamily N-acetyltransferase